MLLYLFLFFNYSLKLLARFTLGFWKNFLMNIAHSISCCQNNLGEKDQAAGLFVAGGVGTRSEEGVHTSS